MGPTLVVSQFQVLLFHLWGFKKQTKKDRRKKKYKERERSSRTRKKEREEEGLSLIHI